MKTRIIAAAGIILAAAAAVGDDVTIKSVPYKGVTVTDVRDGEIHFRMSRRSPIIRKPFSEVTAITLADVKRFNKARRLLKVTREALEEIKDLLIDLAKKDGLFPLSDFPVDPETDGNGVIYRLSEDDDHRFALYYRALRYSGQT